MDINTWIDIAFPAVCILLGVALLVPLFFILRILYGIITWPFTKEYRKNKIRDVWYKHLDDDLCRLSADERMRLFEKLLENGEIRTKQKEITPEQEKFLQRFPREIADFFRKYPVIRFHEESTHFGVMDFAEFNGDNYTLDVEEVSPDDKFTIIGYRQNDEQLVRTNPGRDNLRIFDVSWDEGIIFSEKNLLDTLLISYIWGKANECDPQKMPKDWCPNLIDPVPSDPQPLPPQSR